MRKILFIFGTRPEAIKMAPLIIEMKKHPNLHPVICLTAQHREMLDQALKVFSLQANYDLDIMKKDQSLFDVTVSALNALENVIKDVNPDMILIQGDTTTTFVGALVGFYNKIKVAHVEAGLRTFNKFSPYPEEMNRTLTTHLADLHFAPTAFAKKNLQAEGINNRKIFITGNTVIDALFYILKNIDMPPNTDKMILVTGHRRENFGDRFNNICLALKSIACEFPDIQIIYPVHLNSNVQNPVNRLLSGIKNIKLIPPVDYIEFIKLMHQSYLILTDSGGVQEEAPSLGKPVLVMREDTERPEGIEKGTAILLGTNPESIFNEVSRLLLDSQEYLKMSRIANPYGDGKAAVRIIKIIERHMNLR